MCILALYIQIKALSLQYQNERNHVKPIKTISYGNQVYQNSEH